MNKVLLIIHREYFTRVRKKSFIVMIFVVPTLIFVMSAVIALVAKNSGQLSTQQVVKVLDESGVFAGKFHDARNIKFETTKQSLAAVKQEAKNDENLSALRIPVNYKAKDAVEIY